jgi:hypothetical protein
MFFPDGLEFYRHSFPMQPQIDYINGLASEYSRLADDSDLLYAKLTALTPEELTDIHWDYGDTDRPLQPVRLLRAVAAQHILQRHPR